MQNELLLPSGIKAAPVWKIERSDCDNIMPGETCGTGKQVNTVLLVIHGKAVAMSKNHYLCEVGSSSLLAQAGDVKVP